MHLLNGSVARFKFGIAVAIARMSEGQSIPVPRQAPQQTSMRDSNVAGEGLASYAVHGCASYCCNLEFLLPDAIAQLRRISFESYRCDSRGK